MREFFIYSFYNSSYYNTMPKLPRQDNKTYRNTGTGNLHNGGRIRYPKKCRKTAWKRFYKLFPTLKKDASAN